MNWCSCRRAASPDCCDVALRDVLHDILSPYAIKDIEERYRSPGPMCGCQCSVTSIAMICHELATNAAKYGALASPRTHRGGLETDGAAWRSAGRKAAVGSVKPDSGGFGTTLIRRSVEGLRRCRL